MTDEISLTLNRIELDQLLEGLSDRAESWERTAEALRASRYRTSEVGSRNASPSGARFSHTRGTSEFERGAPPLPHASDDGEPEDFSDEVLESRRFCMQSSLAGLTALQIAARYRKVMDKILDQAQAAGWKA